MARYLERSRDTWRCAGLVNDAERKQLAVLAEAHGWPVALVIAFSAKESFYKAPSRAVGHLFDFDAIRLADCSADEGSTSNPQPSCRVHFRPARVSGLASLPGPIP